MRNDIVDNELNAWDRDHFFHPSTHMAQHARGETPNRIITGAEGVHIVDRQGKRSLDAFAGLYCVNVGYGRTKITDAGMMALAAAPKIRQIDARGTKATKEGAERAKMGRTRVEIRVE